MSDPLLILQGDATERLRELPTESVQCCVTSPPYWGLRDYGTATAWEGGDITCDHEAVRRPGFKDKSFTNAGSSRDPVTRYCRNCGAHRIDEQVGLEKTPEEYVSKMVEIFREVRRVLRKDGTLWLNLGDSYATGTTADRQASTGVLEHHTAQDVRRIGTPIGLKTKDLCGIPWRVAFALQADGWWLRSDIIWHKPNPMPESVTDRPTKSHEYLFLLTKASSYYYDAEAIKEKLAYATVNDSRMGMNRFEHNGKTLQREKETNGNELCASFWAAYDSGRNKRSVWTVATAPYPEAHFATYPPDLIKPCIVAESSKGCCAACGAPWERIVERSGEVKNVDYAMESRSAMQQGGIKSTTLNGVPAQSKTTGWRPTCGADCTLNEVWHSDHKCRTNPDTDIVPCTVLDPFAGSGTTGMVALELGRKAVLIELNPKYVELIRQRCDVTPGLALAT